MSKPSPGVPIGTAFGVAVAAALAQLGLVTGLAILIWRDGTVAEWSAHLSWATWLTAVSTVIGSLTAGRLTTDVGTRVTATLAAGIGAFVVAPLIAVPAMRFADTGLTTAPFASAGIGVAAGLVMAGLGLASRPVALNVIASICLTWVLAGLASFVPVGDDVSSLVRLGVWGSWADLVPEVAPPMLLGCVLIGAATAWAAGLAGKSDHRVIAVSGAAGPLLVVAGYAASAQPDVGTGTDWTGIWMGVYAALAGLLGSLLVTALRRSPAPSNPPAPTATATAAVPVAAAPEPAALPEPDNDRTFQVPAADPYVSADYDGYDQPAWGDTEPAAEYPPSPSGDSDPYWSDEPEQPQPAAEPAADTGAVPYPKQPTETGAEEKPKRFSRKKSKSKQKPADEPLPIPEQPEPEAVPDETESWVSDLKDDTGQSDRTETEPVAVPDTDSAPPKPKKKSRFGRRKSSD